MLTLARTKGEFVLLASHILFGFVHMTPKGALFRVRNLSFPNAGYPLIKAELATAGNKQSFEIAADDERSIACDVGEEIRINGEIFIRLDKRKGNNSVRLQIAAPSYIEVRRGEVGDPPCSVMLIKEEMMRMLGDVKFRDWFIPEVSFHLSRGGLHVVVPGDELRPNGDDRFTEAVFRSAEKIFGRVFRVTISCNSESIEFHPAEAGWLTRSRKLSAYRESELSSSAVELSPAVLAVTWDPQLITSDEYAELVEIFGDLVRANGGTGVRRLLDEDVGVIPTGVLQP